MRMRTEVLIAPSGIEIAKRIEQALARVVLIAPSGIEIDGACKGCLHAVVLIAPSGIEMRLQALTSLFIRSFNRTKWN